jgi:D-alanine-D-alanine ligase
VEPVRVGVIMGGTSSEREVSLLSGDAVAEALEERGHDVVRIVLGNGMDALEALASADIDAAFLALQGRQGEDGCMQGVLEMLGIPYTGSGVLASALAMDKVKSKELFRLHNVPTPPYYLLGRTRLLDLESEHGSFGYPVVVKPRREGSSAGLGYAANFEELRSAVESALLYDDDILVERYVEGQEVAVALLNGRVLGAIEIVSGDEHHIPARLPETRLQGVLNIAERAAEALDVRGAVRVDMIITPGMNEYVLEANTLPRMTVSSLVPKVAAAAGYDFGALCEAMLREARLDSGLGLERLEHDAQSVTADIWQEAELYGSDLAWMPRGVKRAVEAARSLKAG